MDTCRLYHRVEMCVGSRLDGMFSEVTEDGRERRSRSAHNGSLGRGAGP